LGEGAKVQSVETHKYIAEFQQPYHKPVFYNIAFLYLPQMHNVKKHSGGSAGRDEGQTHVDLLHASFCSRKKTTIIFSDS
jgi:hypothetical protein